MTETTRAAGTELSKVEEILQKRQEGRWSLIPLLHEIQESLGYIPPAVIPYIAESVNLFPSQVQGVITFYSQFYTSPRGRNIVRVCRGTACHVRGGKTILKLVKQHLGIEEGQTTPDYEYTLETVACIGVCALAPNITINKQTYGHINPKKVSLLLGRMGQSR